MACLITIYNRRKRKVKQFLIVNTPTCLNDNLTIYFPLNVCSQDSNMLPVVLKCILSIMEPI